MVYGISIFRKVQCWIRNGRPYGTSAPALMLNMLWLWGYAFLAILALYVDPTSSELEYFPGLRRPPPLVNWAQQSDNFLAQLIEENARRRLQPPQLHLYHQAYHQRGPNTQDDDDLLGPSFTYKFPENIGQSEDDEMPFAVNPLDPRYYESSTSNIDKTKSYNNGFLNAQDFKTKFIEPTETKDDVPYYKPKSPMNVNPKLTLENTFPGTTDLDTLMGKLQRNGQGNLGKNEVVKKHMEIDGAMGMYIVALIAGISAAVTVGFIALAIGWYTLDKRTKAAADVDYPAYGVTGPNKDVSPSGDRRLAQSAQMYHYQHQKQQIIAMENRASGEHHGSMSDVESDDDNEEGDYTVYECPGLAPTGEMEVKNPLFLDDTPVTPSSNPTEQQNSQQQNQQTIQKQPAKKTNKTIEGSTQNKSKGKNDK